MTLRPSSQGHRREQWAENENRKAPSVAGGAQKICVRELQRTRNLSPAHGGLEISHWHSIAVRLKLRITIPPESRLLLTSRRGSKRARAVAELLAFVNSLSWRTRRSTPANKPRAFAQQEQTERFLSVCHFTIAAVVPARYPIYRALERDFEVAKSIRANTA